MCLEFILSTPGPIQCLSVVTLQLIMPWISKALKLYKALDGLMALKCRIRLPNTFELRAL